MHLFHRCTYFIARAWRMPWHDRLLLVEATAWLALSSIAIATLPFRYIMSIAARPACHSSPAKEVRMAIVQHIRWSILVCARQLPWGTACFHKGLAAQWMLRRRGVPTVLYYGAALDGAGLRSHVWVKEGAVDVVGGELAPQFGILASFPASAEQSIFAQWT